MGSDTGLDVPLTVDYEAELRSVDQLLSGRRARTRIRIFVDSVCLTDPEGAYTASDFLPHNCTKLLRTEIESVFETYGALN